MALVLSVGPTIEPVSLSEIKTHCRIVGTAEDAILRTLIATARQYAETFTRRAFIFQTWKLYADAFPSEFNPPRPPLSTVTTLKYYDGNGAQQTVTNTVYTVNTDRTPGAVYLAYGQTWPSGIYDIPDAVELTYVAGYAAAPTGTVFTAVAATEICTATAHGLTTGEEVAFTTTTTLPGGLSLATAYNVRVLTANTFTVHANEADALANASIVDITGTGTGTHTVTGTIVSAVPEQIRQAIKMLAAHYYENREALSPVSLMPVPMAVDSLLWQYRVLDFA